MSRFLVVECDASEMRLAIGSSGLTGISIERVLSVPLQLGEGEEPWGSEATVASLKSLMQESGFKSGDAIACVSRNDIELRAITLPDVDANELPDMVRFATPRYFANVTDSWPLDFITMPSHLEGSIDCVVGAINPTLLQKIDRTIAQAGLTLKHVFLRPMSALAGALARHPEWLNESVLFMDLLNEEADVVISERGNAVFMRNFHAPGEGSDPGSAKLFAAEIKRTLLAAASQRPGLKVDRIVLWSKESMAPVADALGRAVELPVALVDPFAWAEKANIAIAATTQTVGRFAPVLGAFYFLQNRNRLIDFLNPRKRVEKKKPIARYLVAAGVGAALLAGGWWWYQSSHAALDSEIALLRDSIKNEEGALKTSAKNLADWKKVENFLRGDVPWLDELENLSKRAKDADQAYFGTTTFSIEPRSNTASISAKYFAKQQDVVPDVQTAYRDTQHTVKGTAVTQSPNKNYPWASDLTITLAAREVPDPRFAKKPPPAQPEEPLKIQESATTPQESPAKQETDPSPPQSPSEPAEASADQPAGPAPATPAPATPNSDAVILGDAS
ncbi:MAG: type IV pilus biogenesis protein PilM [Planctomycetota bacterium]